MKLSVLVPVVLVLFSSCANFVSAQQPASSQSPPIRVQVEEVPVDVIVTDKRGEPVPGLQPSDFSVFEDGVEQKILHFGAQGFEAKGKGESQAQQLPATLAPPPNRVFLIVFGRGRHDLSFQAIPKLMRFIREELTPSDWVAVMAFNRASDFITDHEKVAQIIKRYEKIGPEIEISLRQKEMAVGWLVPGQDFLGSHQKKIDAIFEGVGGGSRSVIPGRSLVREARIKDRETVGRMLASEQRQQLETDKQEATLLVGAGAEGRPGNTLDRVSREMKEGLLDGLSLQDHMADRAAGNMDAEHLFAAVQYLRFMPGEKHLLFITGEGLHLPGLEQDQGLGSLASDARVRIHTVLTAGVSLGNDSGSFNASAPNSGWAGSGGASGNSFAGSHVKAFAIQAIRNLSGLSGGVCLLREDMEKALRTITRTVQTGYVLGYVPSNADVDRKFRRIRVRVKEKRDLLVRHRSGYYADASRPYDPEKFKAFSRTGAALSYEAELKDVKFSFKAEKVRSAGKQAGKTRIGVTLSCAPSADVYSVEGDRHAGKLFVSYFFLKENGEACLERWDDLTMNFPEGTYQKVMQEGFRLERQFEVSAEGDLLLHVIVYDLKNDRLGSHAEKVK